MWAGEQCRPVGSARPKRLLPTRRLRPLSVRAQQLSPRAAHSWDEFEKLVGKSDAVDWLRPASSRELV